MDFHQFNKEHYFFEVNRRHQLTANLAIPIGILTILGGALLVVATAIKTPLGILDIAQLVLLASAAITMSIAIYFLVRSYFNYSYSYIATPKELKDYMDSLIVYYEQNGGNKKDAESELEDYVNSEYAKHTHKNTENNDIKSHYIHRANGYLIASLVLVILAGLPYVAKSVAKAPTIQKMEIVNADALEPRARVMRKEQKQEPTRQHSAPPPAEKPKQPPGRQIKESEKPRRQN